MPVYLQCPHCKHPQIVAPRRRGRTLFCRQCGRAYLTSKRTSDVLPLDVNSYGDLQRRRNPSGVVYLIS